MENGVEKRRTKPLVLTALWCTTRIKRYLNKQNMMGPGHTQCILKYAARIHMVYSVCLKANIYKIAVSLSYDSIAPPLPPLWFWINFLDGMGWFFFSGGLENGGLAFINILSLHLTYFISSVEFVWKFILPRKYIYCLIERINESYIYAHRRNISMLLVYLTSVIRPF